MDAQDMVICGALQIVASRLLGQLSIEVQGDTEFHQGIWDLEAAREESRGDFEQPTARSRARHKVAQRKPKPANEPMN